MDILLLLFPGGLSKWQKPRHDMGHLVAPLAPQTVGDQCKLVGALLGFRWNVTPGSNSERTLFVEPGTKRAFLP